MCHAAVKLSEASRTIVNTAEDLIRAQRTTSAMNPGFSPPPVFFCVVHQGGIPVDE